MDEWNTIAYIMRDGYEIKTWIHADTDDDLVELAKKRFKEVGVTVKDNDEFDFEVR